MLDNPYKSEISIKTNPERQSGSLDDVLKGADVFIGVSGKGNIITKDIIQSMEHDPVVFALSNPDPYLIEYLIQKISFLFLC